MESFLIFLLFIFISVTQIVSFIEVSNGKQYQYNVFRNESAFNNALDTCVKLNMSLIYIRDAEQQNKLNVALRTFYNDNNETFPKSFYIGLMYSSMEMRWTSGFTTLARLRWNKTMPKPANTNCAYLQDDGVLNMGRCSTPRAFVCSNQSAGNIPDPKPTEFCPSGFFLFNGRCYLTNTQCKQQLLNRSQARELCESKKSSLMSVDNFQEEEFLTALMTALPAPSWLAPMEESIGPGYTFWLDPSNRRMSGYAINFKKNEPNGKGKEPCLMTYHRLADVGRMNDENCSKSMNFICEASTLSNAKPGLNGPNPILKRGSCKPDYFEFNQTCYRPHQSGTPNGDPKCMKNPSLVYGAIDLAFLRVLMTHAGLSQVKVTFHESVGNGIAAKWFNVSGGQVVPHTCYWLRADTNEGKTCAEAPNVGTPEICQYNLDSYNANNQRLICPMHWLHMGTDCYRVVSGESVNFTTALKRCQTVYHGTLASFDQMKQAQSVDSVMRADAWIGMNGTSYIASSWIDGTPLTYCLFRHTSNLTRHVLHTQKLPVAQQICFVMRNGKVEWDDRLCGQMYNFVCMKPAVANPCRLKFSIYVDGACYMRSEAPLSWSSAEKKCMTYGSTVHLASFHTAQQQELVMDQMKPLADPVWTGLKLINKEFIWSEGSPLLFLKYFEPGDELHGTRFNCMAALKRTKGAQVSWELQNCALQRLYMCRDSNHTRATTLRPPTTPPAYSSVCPRGFSFWSGSCFKHVTEPETWFEANKKCKSLYKDQNSMLATFNSLKEYDFVLSMLRPPANHSWATFIWIGYYMESHSKQFVALTQDPEGFIVPPTVQSTPLSGEQMAINSGSNPFTNGEWLLRNGSADRLTFICRTVPLPSSATEGRRQDNPCIGLNEHYHHGSCYSILHQTFNHQNAIKSCAKIGSQLVMLDDIYEEKFLGGILQQRERNAWLALRINSSNYLRDWRTSTDGGLVLYSHWQHVTDSFPVATNEDPQPQRHFSHHCVAVKFKNVVDPRLSSGMTTVDCDARLTVVCERRISAVAPQPRCGRLNNGSIHDLNVTHSSTGLPCIRWDTVQLKNEKILNFVTRTKLRVSLPYDSQGYLSYGMDRCSQMMGEDKDNLDNYACYVHDKDNFVLRNCDLKQCVDPANRTLVETGHAGRVMLDIVFFLLLVACLVLMFMHRRRILANYTVQACLARVLGRYQPDWLTNRGQRPVPTLAGHSPASDHPPGTLDIGQPPNVSFVNPVYTPLQQDSDDKF